MLVQLYKQAVGNLEQMGKPQVRVALIKPLGWLRGCDQAARHSNPLFPLSLFLSLYVASAKLILCLHSILPRGKRVCISINILVYLLCIFLYVCTVSIAVYGNIITEIINKSDSFPVTEKCYFLCTFVYAYFLSIGFHVVYIQLSLIH